MSFNNPLVVSKILKNGKAVAGVPKWQKINISDDKSPMQIKELNDLRIELKHRIRGESNIDIKYISGKPTITCIAGSKSAKN